MKNNYPEITTQEANKKIVKDFINELMNNHNPKAWDMYCSEDFKHHFNIPDVPPNRQGIKMLSTGILAAFPDVSLDIEVIDCRK